MIWDDDYVTTDDTGPLDDDERLIIDDYDDPDVCYIGVDDPEDNLEDGPDPDEYPDDDSLY